MACGNVEVVDPKGCSRLVIGLSSGISAIGSRRFAEPMSSASAVRHPAGPFSGLVICVTGLSKGKTLVFALSEVVIDTCAVCFIYEETCIFSIEMTISVVVLLLG